MSRTMSLRRLTSWISLSVLVLAGCGGSPAGGDDLTSAGSGTDTSTDTQAASESAGDSETGTASETSTETGTETEGGEDPVLEAEDFGCILDWPKVRRFRVTNVLGDVDATLAVAESPDGGDYPVGSLVQLVPTEAMLKRAPGFAPAAHDWEFFSLAVDADGTEILARGSEEVINAFGGNCFDCHSKATAQWDFICEQDHGCDPLPLTAEQIEGVQNSDPRCP